MSSDGAPKKSFFSGITGFIKDKSDALKDKVEGLFKKKDEVGTTQQTLKPVQATTVQATPVQEPKQDKVFVVEETNTSMTYGIKSTDNEEDDEILEDSDSDGEGNGEEGDDGIKKKEKKPKEVVSRVVEEEEDEEYCTMHKLYIKGTQIDIEDLPTVPFYRLKPVNKILSVIGFGKNNKKEVKYYTFLDEYFLYFIREPETAHPTLKKVGNRHDLRVISNLVIKEIEQGRYSFEIIFFKDIYDLHSEKYSKEIFFYNRDDAVRFYNQLRDAMKKFKILQANEDALVKKAK